MNARVFKSDLLFHERIPGLLPSRVGVGVDLFPYTIEEFQKLKAEPGSVPHTALKEGLLLAGAIP